MAIDKIFFNSGVHTCITVYHCKDKFIWQNILIRLKISYNNLYRTSFEPLLSIRSYRGLNRPLAKLRWGWCTFCAGVPPNRAQISQRSHLGANSLALIHTLVEIICPNCRIIYNYTYHTPFSWAWIYCYNMFTTLYLIIGKFTLKVWHAFIN